MGEYLLFFVLCVLFWWGLFCGLAWCWLRGFVLWFCFGVGCVVLCGFVLVLVVWFCFGVGCVVLFCGLFWCCCWFSPTAAAAAASNCSCAHVGAAAIASQPAGAARASPIAPQKARERWRPIPRSARRAARWLLPPLAPQCMLLRQQGAAVDRTRLNTKWSSAFFRAAATAEITAQCELLLLPSLRWSLAIHGHCHQPRATLRATCAHPWSML